ncbi:hypothetical protein CIB48_g5901 [Xylaria polymorpha]|nr:hypothetical protein CIB48_g5901 [Xylaria polymorpha]
MQFSVLFAAVFATAVAASPFDMPAPPKRAYYSSSPTSTMPAYPHPTTPAVPRSPDEFRYICAAGGQRARCCVVPVAGQALLCETPAGV